MIQRLHVKGTCPKPVAGAPPVSVRPLQPNLLPADTLPCGETAQHTFIWSSHLHNSSQPWHTAQKGPFWGPFFTYAHKFRSLCCIAEFHPKMVRHGCRIFHKNVATVLRGCGAHPKGDARPRGVGLGWVGDQEMVERGRGGSSTAPPLYSCVV